MITDPNFRIYKNLMFYNKHQVDYFYFSSLETYIDKDERYNLRAKEIAESARKILNRPSFFQDDPSKEMPALQMLEQALNFLQQALIYERQNEVAYFKQKYALLKANFTSDELQTINEIADLENLFSNDNVEQFDYNKLILLINILEQGLKETKTVAKYEKDRIETIIERMAEIKSSRRNQLEGLWDSQHSAGLRKHYDNNKVDYLIAANKRFHRNIEISYAQHGNLSSPLDSSKRKRIWGAKKYLSDIPETVDVKVGQWITKHINDIFNSPLYYTKYQKLASQYVKTGVANTDNIREILVKAITDDGVRHTVEILEETYKNLPADQFINTLASCINTTRQYSIKGYYSNFGQFGKSLDFFSNKQLKNGMEVADGLFEAYSNLVKELKKNKNKKINKDESFLMKAMQGTNHIQTYNRLISLVDKLEKSRAQYLKIQKQIQSGRKTDNGTIERILNLGSDGTNTDVKIRVYITADEIRFEGDTINSETHKRENTGLIDKINSLSLIKKLGNGKTKATTLDGLIVGLKTKGSHTLRDDLSQMIATGVVSLNSKKTSAQIRDSFEKALTGLTLSVGGPTVSEMAPLVLNALQKDILVSHHTGKINRRNDTVTITLKYDNITLKTTLTNIVNTAATDLIDKLDPELEKIQKQYIKDFEDNFYREMSKLKTDNPDFNSLAKNEQIWFDYAKEQEKKLKGIKDLDNESSKLWSEYEEDLKKQNISEEEINKKRMKILESLQDSFFISDTMKTYNQYQNNLGFTGASLGANVNQQLSNISHLFSKAGITMEQSDITWLESAIINCSPVSIIGEKNKDIIQNYLSSMAALAMFDEGGAEAQIIQDLQNKVMERKSTTPDILHLYRVNGIFVPGSVVLERTIKELSKCLDAGSLAIRTMNRGAGVSIINTMHEGLIPNRKTTRKRFPYDDRDPWGTVAMATDKHVKIKIMFLAGLLDIVRDMDKSMNNITLP